MPRALFADVLRRIDRLRPIAGDPTGAGVAMLDRELLKRDPSAGRELEKHGRAQPRGWP